MKKISFTLHIPKQNFSEVNAKCQKKLILEYILQNKKLNQILVLDFVFENKIFGKILFQIMHSKTKYFRQE